MSKFDNIKKELKDYWGFDLWRNTSDNLGFYPGSWKSGYTICGNLRGHFYERFTSLAQIERKWLRHRKDKEAA